MRLTSELIHELEEAVSRDEARRVGYEARCTQAKPLAACMPWIHRTGKESDWDNVLSMRRLSAKTPCTDFEKNAGISSTVYFFVGYPAYPKGGVALVFKPMFLSTGSFTPFDSGSLEETRGHLDTAAGLSKEGRSQLFHRFFGPIDGLKAFLVPYLAAHFHDPMDYIRREQCSLPDHAAYHGLIDRGNDRRAWTVETQVHHDVQFADGMSKPLRILFENKGQFEELEFQAPEFMECSVLKEERDDFQRFISQEVERLVGQAR